MADEAGAAENEDGAQAPEASEPEEVESPPGDDLKDLIESEFPGSVLEQSSYNNEADEVTFALKTEDLVRVATYLRDHPSSRFAMLSDLTAAHYPDEEKPFHVLYQLYSFDHNRRLRLKVKLGGDQAPSTVAGVWSSANWMEREVYDLFGIRFEGHPDLRRILLPDDWGSYPLQKSYPLEGLGERVYSKPGRKEIGE